MHRHQQANRPTPEGMWSVLPIEDWTGNPLIAGQAPTTMYAIFTVEILRLPADQTYSAYLISPIRWHFQAINLFTSNIVEHANLNPSFISVDHEHNMTWKPIWNTDMANN